MNKKNTEAWKDNPLHQRDKNVHERLRIMQKPGTNHPQVNGLFMPIDPKLLQRYSLDDNGGSYKGL